MPSAETSHDLLEFFRTRRRTEIDLTLRPAYRTLLEKLGSPHLKLPPTFHVAGTNGKGSTCAFLRAMLEAAGYSVHVYTSPHLVSYHERIRLAGTLIGEDELVALLQECKTRAGDSDVTLFEALTAVALTAFARTPADFTILEVGLGGRLDATNVIERPLASVIARLSMDHREYLGDRIEAIAREKAGIMRAGVPCYAQPQPDLKAAQTLIDVARDVGTKLHLGERDWNVTPHATGFVFKDKTRDLDLPLPALLGAHQFKNAGLAIAALGALPKSLPLKMIEQGLRNVQWPARLQHLTSGALVSKLPATDQLWLDGGHNDSAGAALATQAKAWHDQDARPLHLICGMLTTKMPMEFLGPLAPHIASLQTLTIPNEALSFDAETLAHIARDGGVARTHAAQDLPTALGHIPHDGQPARILICGSLYLAGIVLRENAAA